MQSKLCKHGYVLCIECAIKEETNKNFDSRIQRTPIEPTRYIQFDNNRKYY